MSKNKDVGQPQNDSPMAAWFLGPKAEHGEVLFDLLTYKVARFVIVQVYELMKQAR